MHSADYAVARCLSVRPSVRLSVCLSVTRHITKTQVMWLGWSQQLDKIAIKDTARDLGVVLDRQLSLDAHVTAVCRSGYYQLRQLWPIARSLSVEAAKSLVQAFISSHIDYCNAILHGLHDRLMRRLPSVQNTAARLITGEPGRDYIIPLLRQLNWLPVRRRVDFKMAVLVFQCLTGQTPGYLAEDRQLVASTNWFLLF